MKEIHVVYAHLGRITEDNPGGRALEVFYLATDDAVTLCSEQGDSIRDKFGNPVSKKLAPGEDAAAVARNLGLRHFHAARDPLDDFRRPLTASDYGPRGWR
jgi:hypothetical protein